MPVAGGAPTAVSSRRPKRRTTHWPRTAGSTGDLWGARSLPGL